MCDMNLHEESLLRLSLKNVHHILVYLFNDQQNLRHTAKLPSLSPIVLLKYVRSLLIAINERFDEQDITDIMLRIVTTLVKWGRKIN